MPEATPDDLARMREAVQFRDRCVKAAVEHYRRTGLRPIDTYARAAFDAMEDLIRLDERQRLPTRLLRISRDLSPTEVEQLRERWHTQHEVSGKATPLGPGVEVEERMDEDNERQADDDQAATDEPKQPEQPDDKRERGVRRSPADRQIKGAERDR